MTFRTLAVALLATAPLVTAQAADIPSHSYLDVSYLNSKVDISGPLFGGNSDDEVEGFRSAFSLGVAPFLNFIADYEQRRFQDSRNGFGSIGLSGHTTGRAWQAFGTVTYERNDFDDKLGSALDRTEEGLGLAVGALTVINNMEFHAQYKHLFLSQPQPGIDLSGSRYGAGLVLDLSPWWSLTADYVVRTHTFESPGSDGEVQYQEWTVGLRRYFATQTDRWKRTGGLFGGGGSDDAE